MEIWQFPGLGTRKQLKSRIRPKYQQSIMVMLILYKKKELLNSSVTELSFKKG